MKESAAHRYESATPSTLDGLCGPEQRNGVGRIVACGK